MEKIEDSYSSFFRIWNTTMVPKLMNVSSKWSLGIVTEIEKEKDGLVRRATIKYQNSRTEMPINLAVSKNKILFEDLWFKMDEVDKIELGEDQRHLKDLNYTDTNTTSLDRNVTAWSKPDGSPFKDGVRLFKCDKGTPDNNTTHSKEFFRKVTQLTQETSMKKNSKQFKSPYTTVKWKSCN